MKPSARMRAKSIRPGLFCLFAACASVALMVGAGSATAQVKNALPASITSVTQTLPTVAGVPTLLTVTGAGYCRYRLSYVKQEFPLVQQPPMTYSSTSHNPFPMSLRIFDATPAGTYTWTVNGIDGCSGSKSLTFTVR